MEQTLAVSGKHFELVGVQREGVSAVYRGEGCYLRIGAKEKIGRDLAFHRRMEEAGFPVAKLLEDGEHEGMAYFIESSLGERRLGLSFADDYAKTGRVGDEHFTQLLNIVKRHVSAQCSTKTEPSWDDFRAGIYLDRLKGELPQQAAAIEARFEQVKERLAGAPFAVTHGDFNAQNIYASGVIDLEDSFMGPLGYDAMTVLVHLDSFPDSREYEFFAKYRFSDEQKQRYLAEMDALLAPSLGRSVSAYEEEFSFCRFVWSSVRMHEWPKLQKWRYDMLKARFLSG